MTYQEHHEYITGKLLIQFWTRMCSGFKVVASIRQQVKDAEEDILEYCNEMSLDGLLWEFAFAPIAKVIPGMEWSVLLEGAKDDASDGTLLRHVESRMPSSSGAQHLSRK